MFGTSIIMSPSVAKRSEKEKPLTRAGRGLKNRLFRLFPLHVVRCLLSSPILPSSQSSEHGARCGMLRDGGGTALGQKIETQAKLGRGEFRFLSR